MAQKFENSSPEHHRHPPGAVLRWALVDRVTGRRRPQPPGPPAPHVAADLERVCSPATVPRATWIGHSSWLVSSGDTHLLFDPVFSPRIGMFYPRYGEPGLAPSDLPVIDAVLISHNHYDHLDLPSLQQLSRVAHCVVPTGVSASITGCDDLTVQELGWWDSVELDRCRITCVPARHWSRRGLLDTNHSLWCGYVVEPDGGVFYHAGDTAWFAGFGEIAERFPRLTAAMLPIGAYEPAWFMEHNHLNPEQAGAAFLQLGARHMLPMHWGTFQLTDEPLREPAQRLRAWRKSQVNAVGSGAARGDGTVKAADGRPQVHLPAVGESLDLE